MKNDKVPMSYEISKLAYQAQQLYNILYLVYGSTAIIFINYLFRNIVRKEIKNGRIKAM